MNEYIFHVLRKHKVAANLDEAISTEFVDMRKVTLSFLETEGSHVVTTDYTSTYAFTRGLTSATIQSDGDDDERWRAAVEE